jgi:hypothetical protein
MQLSITEVIAKIASALAESNAEDVEQLHNQLCKNQVSYREDSIFSSDYAEIAASGATTFPLSQDAYKAGCGSICPNCGSSNVEGDSIDIDAGVATQEDGCLACDASWKSSYQLIGYSDLVVEGPSSDED